MFSLLCLCTWCQGWRCENCKKPGAEINTHLLKPVRYGDGIARVVSSGYFLFKQHHWKTTGQVYLRIYNTNHTVYNISHLFFPRIFTAQSSAYGQISWPTPWPIPTRESEVIKSIASVNMPQIHQNFETVLTP